jgi:hypothetical protein
MATSAYREYVLTLTFLDAESRETIWTGEARTPEPEEGEADLRALLDRLLAEFK